MRRFRDRESSIIVEFTIRVNVSSVKCLHVERTRWPRCVHCEIRHAAEVCAGVSREDRKRFNVTRCGDSASPKGVPNAVEFDIDRQTREFASAVNALSQEILDPRRQAMSDENALAFLAFPNEIQQADDERINRAYGIQGERTILCRCRTMIPASDHFN